MWMRGLGAVNGVICAQFCQVGWVSAIAGWGIYTRVYSLPPFHSSHSLVYSIQHPGPNSFNALLIKYQSTLALLFSSTYRLHCFKRIYFTSFQSSSYCLQSCSRPFAY
ncbi:hypothetical protein R3P38DRAFT_2859154 [Favolaschia claudopus]|uniref:Secreted protein n=1 Tax=Favolaschia claudopus TaxID=2862362 RepID=A0AAW0DNQ5_9AGAR